MGKEGQEDIQEVVILVQLNREVKREDRIPGSGNSINDTHSGE